LSSFIRDIWESVKGGERDYTTGGIGRAVVLLAIPMVLEMAMESLFAVVDIYFVSHLGADAIAAVGLTESLMTIIYAISIGLGMAATGLISRRIGEKKPKEASFDGAQTILIGTVVSIGIAIPGFLFASDILRIMGAATETIHTGKGYIQLMLGGNWIIMMLFINNAIFRSAGDAVMAMRVLWLANGINIVLDPLLINGYGPFPELGVTGAAVATNIGRGIAVLYQFVYMLNGKRRISLQLSYFKPNLRVCIKVLKLSAGGVGQFLIATTSWIGLYRIMAIYGDHVIAGYTVALRLIVFTLLPAWGISNAAATLVGQNLGAKQPDRAERSVWITGAINTGYLVMLGTLFFTIPNFFVSLFDVDDQVRQVASRVLQILSMGYLFYGVGMVVSQAFNGAGDTVTPTILNFICFWIIELPLAYWMARYTGLAETGVFYSVVVAESLLAVLGVLVFIRGRWKRKVV